MFHVKRRHVFALALAAVVALSGCTLANIGWNDRIGSWKVV